MEELTAIKTADGREFKPWATNDDLQAAVQDPASVTAIAVQYANSRIILKQALDAKGVEYDENASLEDLAGLCVTEIVNVGISSEGCELFEPFKFSNVFENYTVEKLTIRTNSRLPYHYSNALVMNQFVKEVTIKGLKELTTSYYEGSRPYNFNPIIADCSNLEKVTFEDLQIIGASSVRYNIGYGCPKLKYLYYPELVEMRGPYTVNIEAGVPLLELLYAPKLEYINTERYVGGSFTTIVLGKLSFLPNGQLLPFAGAKTQRLELGVGTNINIYFSNWTGGALSDEMLNTNFREGVIDNLYNWTMNPDNLTDDGNHVITTLFTSRLNADNIQALIDKGWIIA